MISLTIVRTQEVQISKVIKQLSNQQQQQQKQFPLFHEETNLEQSKHIKVNDKQYAFIPEIDQDYNIVHTVIYPKINKQNNRFITNVPKDNFVNKLKQTSNTKETTQNQDKAHQILKTQTEEINKKISTQTIKQNQIQNKIEQDKQDKTLPKQTQTTIKPSTQQLKQQKQQKPQQKPIIKQDEDLFTINNNNKINPNIDQTQQKIQFKQHQFSQPLKIKNYPFQQQNIKKQQIQIKKQDELKQNKPNQQQNVKKQEIIVKKQEVIGKKQQTKKQNQKTLIKPQPEKTTLKETKKQQIVQKSNLQTQKQTQKEQKITEKQPTKQTTKKEQKQSQKSPQLIQTKKQQSFDETLKIDQEYKKLAKALQIDKDQLKSYLDYENKVQDDISDRNWKFLLAKVLIWIAIVISLYQAMCSSESRLSKAEKEKYAPVETEMFQSRENFQISEDEFKR